MRLAPHNASVVQKQAKREQEVEPSYKTLPAPPPLPELLIPARLHLLKVTSWSPSVHAQEFLEDFLYWNYSIIHFGE